MLHLWLCRPRGSSASDRPASSPAARRRRRRRRCGPQSAPAGRPHPRASQTLAQPSAPRSARAALHRLTPPAGPRASGAGSPPPHPRRLPPGCCAVQVSWAREARRRGRAMQRHCRCPARSALRRPAAPAGQLRVPAHRRFSCPRFQIQSLTTLAPTLCCSAGPLKLLEVPRRIQSKPLLEPAFSKGKDAVHLLSHAATQQGARSQRRLRQPTALPALHSSRKGLVPPITTCVLRRVLLIATGGPGQRTPLVAVHTRGPHGESALAARGGGDRPTTLPGQVCQTHGRQGAGSSCVA